MTKIKTKTGIKPSRDSRSFLLWEGLYVVKTTKYVEQVNDVFTLIFKRELNPFLKFAENLDIKPAPKAFYYMSFMNIHFYNLMRNFTGSFWEKSNRKELLLTKVWHSDMYLLTGNPLNDNEVVRKYLIDISAFIKRYELVLELNGVENPMVVITFENNFLVEGEWEIIQNDFNEITSNYEDLPNYILDYAGNEKLNVYALFR